VKGLVTVAPPSLESEKRSPSVVTGETGRLSATGAFLSAYEKWSLNSVLLESSDMKSNQHRYSFL
jgi:hypothetical protein